MIDIQCKENTIALILFFQTNELSQFLTCYGLVFCLLVIVTREFWFCSCHIFWWVGGSWNGINYIMMLSDSSFRLFRWTLNIFSVAQIGGTWWCDIIIFFQDNSIRFFFFWLEIKILECTSFGWSHNQFLHFNWEMHPIFTSIKTKWFLNKKRQL